MDCLGRKIKEQSSAPSDDNSDSHGHQGSPTLPFDQSSVSEAVDSLEAFSSQPLSPLMDALMADDVSFKSTSPYPNLDPLIPQMPGSDSNPFSFPLSHGCGCNGVTGPCARHLEEIKSQVFNNSMTAQAHFTSPYARGPQGSTQFEGSLDLPAVAFDGSSSGGIDISLPQESQPQQPSSHPLATTTSAPSPKEIGLPLTSLGSLTQLNKTAFSSNDSLLSHRHSSSSSVSRQSVKSPLSSARGTPITPPTSEDSISFSNGTSSPSQFEARRRDSRSHSISSIHRKSSDNTASETDTARFKTILESVNAAGFADFDRMVAAYYTTSFDKGSVPEMAQRASRGRRLGKVVKDVHKSSRRWPRWEARGFRESAMESASKFACLDITITIECLLISQFRDNLRRRNGESRAVPPTT